jgi:membrane associated rhomboid family serine protease
MSDMDALPNTSAISQEGAQPKPSENQVRVPWLTALLIIASVASTGLAKYFPEPTYTALYAGDLEIWLDWKWWGLITSTFLHVDFLHLVFNCYWVGVLGHLVENELSRLRYLGLVLFTAWLGSAGELAVSGQTGIGMSGTVYGLFGYILVNRSRHPAFARAANMQTIALMLGWLVWCFIATYKELMQVANFAHLTGLIAGGAAGLSAQPGRWRTPARLAVTALGLASFIPLCWAPWLNVWHVANADRALNRRDFDAALISLDRVGRMLPDYATWVALNRSYVMEERKDYAASKEILFAAAPLATDPMVWNNLGWLLGTCPDDTLRNGAQAVEWAKRACEATDWGNPGFLDTLAAAYAEIGNFEEAMKWSAKSLETPHTDTQEFRLHHATFSQGKPWRGPN